ncbi:hypothetical protein QR680_003486 [Steinernema hermaphroditum]|uniref:B30.2/SPRY domain-containing protein n=1 Tax=Steinernema hermaphroditum TaxID=289476 RepID=A0AA39LS20_9BILA|nr:hypothetical protein QR680_003486 [Steinernema hermaphroditum]
MGYSLLKTGRCERLCVNDDLEGMSTRSSRRSAGGASGTLNPSVIPLLAASRLKSELSSRGLDATGPQHVLADRLLQAVELEKMGCEVTPQTVEQALNPPAQSPAKRKRTRTVNPERKQDEASPTLVVRPKDEAKPKQPASCEHSESTPAQAAEVDKMKSAVTSQAVEQAQNPPAPSPAKRKRIRIVNVERKPVETSPTLVIQPKDEDKHKQPATCEHFEGTPPQVEKMESAVSSQAVEQALNPPAPSSTKRKKIRIVNLERKRAETSPTLVVQPKDETKPKQPVTSDHSESTPSHVAEVEKIGSAVTSQAVEQSRNPLAPNLAKRKKKSIQLPSRSINAPSSSFDILDSIMCSQAELMKAKSNEEKQAELVEMAKRRLSSAATNAASSPASVDKRKALSIDVSFSSPSGPSTPLSNGSARGIQFVDAEMKEAGTPPTPVMLTKEEVKAKQSGAGEYPRLPSPPMPPVDLLPPPPLPPILAEDSEAPTVASEPKDAVDDESAQEITGETVKFEPMDTSGDFASGSSPFVPSPSAETIASALAPVEELPEEKPSSAEPRPASVTSEEVKVMENDDESPEPYVPEDPPASSSLEYKPTPSFELIKSVASILQNLYAKKSVSPTTMADVDEAVRDVIDELLNSVERLVDDTDVMEVDKENNVSQYIDPLLLHDPRELMKRASDVLGSMSKVKEEVVEYTQELPDPSLVEISDDVPKELEFHGEPVPESDEEDGDALFAAAAGIAHVKKTEKKKPAMPDEDEPIGDDEFELDYFNADLNMKGHVDDKNVIDPDVSDGFALMYGGVKANYGFLIKEETGDSSSLSSRYAFQVKIVECLSIKHVPFEETMPHDVRVGWSVDSGTSTMHVLGEAPNSFGFDMHGRTIQNFTFADYGEPLETDDIVTTVLDLRNRSIDFYKNDTHLGTAFSDLQLPQGLAIFPHVASKNCKVHVNFGRVFGTDDFKKPASLIDETTWLSDVQLREGHVIRSRIAPESKEHCTVLMMVGLPAVGKTTWVRKYLRDHPDEHWILISTDAVSNAMTINGMPRRRVHRGRWDMVMGLIAKAVTRSLHMACRRKHNYIIDMTNVSRDTRRRRLTQFKDFQRKCVVIIPSDEDFQKRQQRQARMEGTGTVPPEAMLELKAVMSIPNQDQEPIEDVVFIEPPVERIMDAIKIVNLYNEEAKPWYQKRYQRGRRGGGTYGSYGDRRREKDEDCHRPPPQKVVITQHMRTNNITSKPRYEQP